MECKVCGKKLCSSDHGYYCGNHECPEYDKDILAYENREENKLEQIREA